MSRSNTSPLPANGIYRLWMAWISPRSPQRERAFVERTLRGFLPVLLIIAFGFALLSATRFTLPIIDLLAFVAGPVIALIVVARGHIYLGGVITVAFLVLVQAGLMFASGYWDGSALPLAMINLLFASLILPRSRLLWAGLAIVIFFIVIVIVQTNNGATPPLENGESFITPTGASAAAVFTILLVLAYVSYLRREFEQRVAEVNDLVATLEARVQARTTELADANEQANHARAEAERANRIKSQFLAAMSHELRTPLNSIINFSEFIREGMFGEVNAEQKEAAGNIVSSSRHLLALINDVLDISKIESGSLQLFVEDGVSIEQELRGLEKTAQTLVQGKPVSIRLELDDPLPTVRGDRLRIRQVLLNLISNACKFTEQGSITISAHQQDASMVISVADTGPGIRQQDMESIFETFRQTEVGLRVGKGTGLGLPIARRLTEAHGGALKVESIYGQGATFTALLPLSSALPLTTA
ncbi:MAG: hypothetical protein IAE80_17370 [Anaerolinea sp.]|nr:hypothetical protein [Anaerolinea sp.]